MSRYDPLQNLEWKGNSKAMYEAILAAVPAFFRGAVIKNIEGWVEKNNVKVVTEDLVFKAVNDLVPADIAQKLIIPELTKMKSS